MACKDCGSECDCDRKESERDESEFHGAFSDDDLCPESEPLSEPTPSENARNRQVVKDLRERWDAIKNPRPIHVFNKATPNHILATMHAVYDSFNVGVRMPLHTLIAMVASRANVAPDEYSLTGDLVRDFARQVPFTLLKGPQGGVGRNKYITLDVVPTTDFDKARDARLVTPIHAQLPSVVNDYTCGCGNTKCSKTEKSCWKCGAPIQVQS